MNNLSNLMYMSNLNDDDNEHNKKNNETNI
jgi:hypothetical protein